jgi:hypothetical protein
MPKILSEKENMILNVAYDLNAYNDPAFKRRGDYDLVEVAKLISGNQVPIAARPRQL